MLQHGMGSYAKPMEGQELAFSDVIFYPGRPHTIRKWLPPGLPYDRDDALLQKWRAVIFWITRCLNFQTRKRICLSKVKIQRYGGPLWPFPVRISHIEISPAQISSANFSLASQPYFPLFYRKKRKIRLARETMQIYHWNLHWDFEQGCLVVLF